MTLDEAIRTDRIDTNDLLVNDSVSHREMSFDEACKWGIIDPDRSFYIDKKDNRRYSLADAASNRKIYLTGGAPQTASDAIKTSMKQQLKVKLAKKEAIPTGPEAFVDHNL